MLNVIILVFVSSVQYIEFVFRLSGQGLPNPKMAGRRGDLIVEFDVKFPESLSSASKELIMNALPA